VDRIWFHEDQQVRSTVLTEPGSIEVLPGSGFLKSGQNSAEAFPSGNTKVKLPARSAGWYPGGEVEYVELSAPSLFDTPLGLRMVQGTLSWHPNGKSREIDFAPPYPEITLAAIGTVQVVHVSYSREGVVASLTFPKLTRIPTPAGEVETKYVEFHPTGRLKKADLTDAEKEFPLRTPSGTLKAGWEVTFYQDGQIESVSFLPKTAHEVSTPLGKVWAKDTVKFYPDGTLAGVVLSTATRISTPLGVLPLDMELEFYPTGAIRVAQIGWHPSLGAPRKTLLPGIGEAFLGKLQFYPNGKVRVAEIRESGVFGGIPVEEYDMLYFSEEGTWLRK
jgi:hypothetical protein